MPITTKYTKQRADQILYALRVGNPRYAASAAGAVSHKTFLRWIDAHPEFAEAVEMAEAEAVRMHVDNINRSVEKGNWTASAWWLERRHPEDFGRVDRVEVYRVEQQAQLLARELQAEGIDVLPSELLREREALRTRQAALPPGGRKREA